jgi:hypothetical protein
MLQTRLLGQLTPTELQNLLLVAVNMVEMRPAAVILGHDRQHKRLLYASQDLAEPDAADHVSNSNTSSSIGQLVEHLITTAVIRGHTAVAAELAATPAAKQLSVQTITQLLYLCIQFEGVLQPDNPQHWMQGADEHEPASADKVAPCFVELCALPGAQDISTSTLARLLQLAARQLRVQLAERLFELPAAQQLTAQQLCELLPALLQQPNRGEDTWGQQCQLAEQVWALPAAHELPPEAAKGLLQGLLRDSDGWVGPQNVAWVLDSERLGSQITSIEALQLLQQAATAGRHCMVNFIAGLAPAASGIDDAEGFAAFLQATFEYVDEYCHVEEAVGQLPVVQQLQPPAVFSLIHSSMHSSKTSTAYRDNPCTYRFLLEHPAVDSFSTASLEHLLLEAAQLHRLQHLTALLKVPAAAQLSASTVTTLLQHAASQLSWSARNEDSGSQDSCRCSNLLLALPVVQQLPAAAVTSILAAAVAAGKHGAVHHLLLLPGAQQASEAEAVGMLQQAAQGPSCIWFAVLQGLPQLANLPAHEWQLSSQQLQRLLHESVKEGNREAISRLCEYAPLCPTIASHGTAASFSAPPIKIAGHPSEDVPAVPAACMQALLLDVITYQNTTDHSITSAAAEQLFQLDSARSVGPGVVKDLWVFCIERSSAAGVCFVGLSPAAQQMDQHVCESLVRAALLERRYGVAYGSTQKDREGVVSSFLQQPAVQRLSQKAVVRLLSECLTLKLHDALLLLHKQLPAAQPAVLEPHIVKHLLFAAFVSQQWESFDWLVGLPAAPVHDEHVAMWLTVRACQLLQ